jgi:HemY protein
MRRLLALVVVVVAVGVAAFLAGRPGQVEITWQGWRIDTSVGVLAAAMVLAVLVVSGLVLLAAALGRMPRNLRRRRAARRREVGEAIMTRGLVALAAGNASEARRHATRAAALLDGAPIPLLLAAEAATRQGDVTAARRSYTALLGRPQTEFLGLRGLLGQALRSGDDAVARHLAERARRLCPDTGWLVDSLLVLQARAGDWAAARAMLAGAARRQVLPAGRARHHQGVVLHALSRDAERRGELRRAAGLAARAQALASDLAEPACHHARLLIALGRRRAAAKAIERAWRTAPHPDLARVYLDIHPEAPPLARATSLQRLARQNPEANESHLAIAEAALAAGLWGEARRHLERAAAAAAIPGVSTGPSRGLCLLMARLEESEPGDAAAARDWRERAIGAPADPAYLCRQCGGDSPEWLALCPKCGGFDTLAWRSPPSGPRSIPGAIIAQPADADAALMLPAPREAGVSASVPSGLAPPPRWDK